MPRAGGMLMLRWLRVLMLAVLNGIVAVYLSAVAVGVVQFMRGTLPLGALLRPAMLWEIGPGLQGPPWGFSGCILLAAFVSGVVVTPFLVEFLAPHHRGSRHQFFVASAVAGIGCGVAVVWLASVLVLLLTALPMRLESYVAPVVALSMQLLGGDGPVFSVLLAALLFASVVLVGGTIGGMLAGALLRTVWPGTLEPLPLRTRAEG